MSQLLGIVALVACVAIVLLLPRQEWPRAPTWMRVTAVAIALALAVFAVVFFQMAGGSRENPGGLVLVAVAGGAVVLALRLVVWACVGRVNPRSIWAATSPDARSRPRGRSR
jgi:formate hydrogenlyase subunit 3/multisubunit Na+/H+ antiporter MnhD subunit